MKLGIGLNDFRINNNKKSGKEKYSSEKIQWSLTKSGFGGIVQVDRGFREVHLMSRH
jgi:hypothetical protein